jgi:hypothetical protein
MSSGRALFRPSSCPTSPSTPVKDQPTRPHAAHIGTYALPGELMSAAHLPGLCAPSPRFPPVIMVPQSRAGMLLDEVALSEDRNQLGDRPHLTTWRAEDGGKNV